MGLDMWLGLALGIVLAVADAVLVRLVIKKGIADPPNASRIVMYGFGGRYALVLGVLALALFVPGLNPLGVVLPLIVQKALMVVLAIVKK